MKKISLTADQKETLISRHKKCRDKRECDRIKAVLLDAKDWSIASIADALLLHETSVTRHINDFNPLGELTSTSGGSSGYLDTEQTKCLITHLCEVTYLHTHQIVAYIKETFEVVYTVSGLNKWLHQHQFSYKQPKGVPHKFDVDKQAAFIEYYAQFKDNLRENEPLLFMDAVHPTQATKITPRWIKKGVDKLIETTGSRTRLNIVGAIRLGHLEEAVIEQYDKTVNGESIVDFLTKTRDVYQASVLMVPTRDKLKQ
jgi:transposase